MVHQVALQARCPFVLWVQVWQVEANILENAASIQSEVKDSRRLEQEVSDLTKKRKERVNAECESAAQVIFFFLLLVANGSSVAVTLSHLTPTESFPPLETHDRPRSHS